MARRTPDPCIIVIFGASGDLARRKLMPALHDLRLTGLLPEGTAIVGTSRTEYSKEEWTKELRPAVEAHARIPTTDESWERMCKDLHYLAGDVTDPGLFATLRDKLEEIDRSNGAGGNRVWYMATLPHLFAPIGQELGKSGLVDTGGWQRLVVEKPFGEDWHSSRDLNTTLSHYFDEDQIFRIDHYLGKETVQNLLVFRFSNAIFEPIWNRRYVDHIQITAAEDIGVRDRVQFYERTGALRDVAQNHLLQLLSLIAMEPPIAWDADSIRDEKVQVLKAVHRWTSSDCANYTTRGQYEGYRDEDGVDPESTTETFFAAKMFVDNWRWAGVPFYLRTGKMLPVKTTEIAIQFQRVPHLLFAKTAVEELEPNVLLIHIQPHEGVSLRFGVKVPGARVSVRTVDMEFDYESDFPSGSPEAYERLLLDCMLGDATLFARSDEIEEAWEIVDPIEHCWAGGRPAFYKPGTWGPRRAEELVRADGRAWREPV